MHNYTLKLIKFCPSRHPYNKITKKNPVEVFHKPKSFKPNHIALNQEIQLSSY